MKFYAFEYHSGRNTTSGQPNATTGRMNTAGNLAIFSKRSARDSWVEKGRATPDMGGNCRRAVTAKEARSLMAGMSTEDYSHHVSMSVDDEI